MNRNEKLLYKNEVTKITMLGTKLFFRCLFDYSPRANPTKRTFFTFFAHNLGHFTSNTFVFIPNTPA